MKEKLSYDQYYYMTQREVGDALGITPAMINDIEKRAKVKIRKMLAARGIKINDLIEVKS